MWTKTKTKKPLIIDFVFSLRKFELKKNDNAVWSVCKSFCGDEALKVFPSVCVIPPPAGQTLNYTHTHTLILTLFINVDIFMSNFA